MRREIRRDEYIEDDLCPHCGDACWIGSNQCDMGGCTCPDGCCDPYWAMIGELCCLYSGIMLILVSSYCVGLVFSATVEDAIVEGVIVEDATVEDVLAEAQQMGGHPGAH